MKLAPAAIRLGLLDLSVATAEESAILSKRHHPAQGGDASDPRRLSFLHPIKSRAISVIIRQHLRSMRQHAAHGTGGKQFMRHTTECPFTQSTMTIATSNDQIGFLLLHELE